jgi:hypothetical protein
MLLILRATALNHLLLLKLLLLGSREVFLVGVAYVIEIWLMSELVSGTHHIPQRRVLVKSDTAWVFKGLIHEIGSCCVGDCPTKSTASCCIILDAAVVGLVTETPIY